jgi:nucleolin
VLLSAQLDPDDKDAKKSFKKAVKALEKEETISLLADGHVKLVRSTKKNKKEKKAKKEKKTKKRELDTTEDVVDHDELEENAPKKQKTEETDDTNDANVENEEEGEEEESMPVQSKGKNKPCKGNQNGITRMFVGNLPFAVDETGLCEFLKPESGGKNDGVTHIKWITDATTGKFYGSAFVEMSDSKSAAHAVTSINGTQLMGRQIKLNFAPAKEGDMWPPKQKVITGGSVANGGAEGAGKRQAGGSGVKAMGPKPDNCVKLFIGNLSYDIDDEGIIKFFGTVDAEVKAVRWLHHKDSGDFKGV